MGAEGKASNKIDDLGGKAKEAVGKVTGDKSTKNEGKLDQAKSSLKDAARAWASGISFAALLNRRQTLE